MNRLQLMDINDLPRGTPLENPLNPRKRRAWNPLNPSPAPGVKMENPSPAPDAMVEMEVEVEFEVIDVALGPSSPTMPPSPATFVECGGSGASTPWSHDPVRQNLRRPLRDVDSELQLNYGSESDDDSDQDEVPQQQMSRVFQGSLDTPLGEEEVVGAVPGTSISPPHPSLEWAEPAGDSEGCFRPNDFFHFEWKSFPNPPIPPSERREEFTGHAGPTEICTNPYEIFTKIWDDEIMERVVRETNKYAQDIVLNMIQTNKLCPRSRMCAWQDTSKDELFIYFAIIMTMGIVIKSRIDEYWTTDCEIFATPGFRAHMSLKRFQLLNKCLHFNDNGNIQAQALSPAVAKLFKLEPVVSHLNAKFQSMYTMGRNIALDESLMQWKGWLSINQFISNKAAKVGIKTYELCESQTGYLWRFDIHAKKYEPEDQPGPLNAFTPAIVLDLVRGLEGKGYCVWMDNFYNSPALARQLKVLGFDVVGTLRTNRQFVPQELANLTKANMRKGEITGFTSGDVDLMVWRDENRVATISTYHGNETGVCNNIVKPCLILDYNIMMGGVDKKDQLLSMYPIERKRTKIWYKKFFRRLLNVSILNSYVIAKKSGLNMEHRVFRKILIESILRQHSTPTKMALPEDILIFEAKTHHILEYPTGATSSRLRRRCCECKKLTRFYCAGCEKTVCIGDCFIILHS